MSLENKKEEEDEDYELKSPDRTLPVMSEITPDVGPAVGRVLPDVRPAKGELGVAFLWSRRVLGEELHDVRVVLIAADAASADDVHDAGQDVASTAAEAPGAWGARCFLLLT